MIMLMLIHFKKEINLVYNFGKTLDLLKNQEDFKWNIEAQMIYFYGINKNGS